MQIAAWNHGIVSCIFTGIDQAAIRRDFQIPQNLVATVVIGFGSPAGKITGKRKNRKLLKDLVYLENFGGTFDKKRIG